MKRFKEFVKKKVAPVIVTAIPVHGKHAVAESLKEDAENPKVFLHQDWSRKNSNKHIADHESYNQANHLINEKLVESQPTFNASHQHAPHVTSYTISSHKLNRYHIERATGKPLTDVDRVNHFERRTKALDETLKQHKLQHDVHLFHGMHRSWDLDKDASQHPERHVRMPAYLSTTHNKAIAKGFAYSGPGNSGDVLHIHAKKGQHGLYIGDKMGTINEHETLLPRNQTLKIHRKPTHLSDGTKVWHAKIIDQPFDG